MKERFAEFIRPTGRETSFGEEEIIVSKTDKRGIITYANDVFLRVASMSEKEALGSPHCIIRNPDMPRGVFKLLWDTLESKREIFAYVNNFARSGDHYWVFAHVTPTLNERGDIIGYHSSRRKPSRAALDKVIPLYASLLEVERKYTNPKDAATASVNALQSLLKDKGLTYDQFVFAL